MFGTTDVYDAASSIGRECQLIVSEYGADILQTLMPQIIYVLEELESCTIYSDMEKKEIERLQNLIQVLRNDQLDQLTLREKYDKNLEQMERSWYDETQRLLKKVSNLELENGLLGDELIKYCSLNPVQSSSICYDNDGNQLSDNEFVSIGQLRSKLSALVTESSFMDSSSLETQSDAEWVLCKEQINKNANEETAGIRLIEQKSRAGDLQLIKQLKECVTQNYKLIRKYGRDLVELGANLHAAEEEVCRLARQSGHFMMAQAPHRRQLDQLIVEKDKLETALCVKERELNDLNKNLAKKEIKLDQAPLGSNSILHLSVGEGLESMPSSKWNADRLENLISLEELRYLLHERNELRCQLIELQEELHLIEIENSKDPEVEGPMWIEPLEKLHPPYRKQSSIKSVFRQVIRKLNKRVMEL